MKVLSHINGTGGARRVGIVGIAALASMALGADPVANATQNSTGFLAAVQAAGVNGIEPALLENGRNVCWQIWNGGYTGEAAAAALRQTYPTITPDQSDKFVLAAYQNLCPVPGAYNWWAYGNTTG
jgi:Protein of unknown function (DUF732)